MSTLKIAYISYEYPPDTSGGGIGTYMEQVAHLMKANGHSVTVFCGTAKSDYYTEDDAIKIYKTKAETVEEFREKVVEQFAQIHAEIGFDIIEGPDYGGDAFFIKKRFKELPYVIKLHSPSYLIRGFNNFYLQYILPKHPVQLLKRKIKQLLQRSVYPHYKKEEDIEYNNILLADCIISPSFGLAKRVAKDWGLKLNKIDIIPNIYKISDEMLNIPLKYDFDRVTFIGKFSQLKGANDLAEAIPIILKQNPAIKFRFIGIDTLISDGVYMSDYIRKKNSDYIKNIEFVGKVPLAKIPEYLSQTDILLCCSLWENYPTVLLEAMSAGRCVVATNVGGIPEMIANGKTGILINPKSPIEIAKAILDLYQNKEKLMTLGKNGRDLVINMAKEENIYTKSYNSYLKAINKC